MARQYQTVPGTEISIPVMSLGDKLGQMKIGSSHKNGSRDPELAVVKPPTLQEAKQVIKVCYGVSRFRFN
jgi:hypothetical protein